MSRPAELELQVSRVVPGSPQQAFDAWTTPSALRRWWGPPGGRCLDAELELRVGGGYRIDNELADGTLVTISGEFLLLDEPDRLAYTWTTDPTRPSGERVVVEFDHHPDGAMVTVTHSRIPDPVLEADHRGGWNSCLHGLAEHLATTGAAG